MAYDLSLVEEKVKPHQVTALHLISAMAFIGAGAIIVVYNYTIPGWGAALLLVGIAILALTIFKNKWVTRSNINVVFRILELVIAACFDLYAINQQWKFPIVIFSGLTAGIAFALYWERGIGTQLQVHIDDEGLRLPVVRRRFIPWNEIENVVIRFGTLTINCLDNHMFQWNLADESVDNARFESYCSQKVEENISKRRNDEW